MVKCDICGEPATVNWQKAWIMYDIDENGDYSEQPTDIGNIVENDHYCNSCWAEEQEEEMAQWNNIKTNIENAIKMSDNRLK